MYKLKTGKRQSIISVKGFAFIFNTLYDTTKSFFFSVQKFQIYTDFFFWSSVRRSIRRFLAIYILLTSSCYFRFSIARPLFFWSSVICSTCHCRILFAIVLFLVYTRFVLGSVICSSERVSLQELLLYLFIFNTTAPAIRIDIFISSARGQSLLRAQTDICSLPGTPDGKVDR